MLPLDSDHDPLAVVPLVCGSCFNNKLGGTALEFTAIALGTPRPRPDDMAMDCGGIQVCAAAAATSAALIEFIGTECCGAATAGVEAGGKCVFVVGGGFGAPAGAPNIFVGNCSMLGLTALLGAGVVLAPALAFGGCIEPMP